MSNLKDIKTARHNLQAARKTESALNNLAAVSSLNEAIQATDLAITTIQSLQQQVKELQDSKECTWHLDDADMWEASCGYACTINEGTPEQNEMKYCCSCGGKLITPPREEG